MSPLRGVFSLLAAGGLVWAGLPLASLATAKPDRLLALGLPDAEGPVMAELALMRAGLWSACPTEAYAPNTPLGAVVAGFSASSPAQQDYLLRFMGLMVKKGCDPNQLSRSGTTPLMDAALYGSPEPMPQLLALGADPLRRKAPRSKPSRLDGARAVDIAAFMVPRSEAERPGRCLTLKLLGKASGPPQVLPGTPAPADPPWHAACN